MLKTYCDHCGREIASKSDQVNVNIYAHGPLSIVPSEYNFHVSCFNEVKNAAKAPIRKHNELEAEITGNIHSFLTAGEIEIPLPDEIIYGKMFSGNCVNCPHTDGTILTSLPPKVRCQITGDYRLYGNICNVDKGTTAGRAAIEAYEKRKAIEAERRKVPTIEEPLTVPLHSLDPSWHTYISGNLIATASVDAGSAATASMDPNMSTVSTNGEVPFTPTSDKEEAP